MAEPKLQPKFIHAASYASLLLQVSEHLFPDVKFFALSGDQRRIVNTETKNLLVQAKWVVDSKDFAKQFAVHQVGVEMAPEGTILGEPLPSSPSQAGHYT